MSEFMTADAEFAILTVYYPIPEVSAPPRSLADIKPITATNLTGLVKIIIHNRPAIKGVPGDRSSIDTAGKEKYKNQSNCGTWNIHSGFPVL
jgi:hypothetical protein